MPRKSTAFEIRLNDIIICLKPALSLLTDLHDVFGTPFVPAISTTILALMTAVPNAKKNKEECVQFLEHIYRVLYAIVNLHIKSESTGSLPPAMLHEIGRFTETLHKIYAFVEAQKEGNRIKTLFRQAEVTSLLKDGREGLKRAMEVFKIDSGVTIMMDIGQMQKTADNMHKELLHLISNLAEGTTSDGASSIYTGFNDFCSQNSSNSFSMLPAKPKIFHGRRTELRDIVKILNQDSARIAILGPGGMGKTSLAKAALHHPDVAAKYEYRYFVPCDSATTCIEVAAIIGAHLGLKPGKDLTKPVVRHLSEKPPLLLILDNLETTWEPIESRGGVEELLSLLTDLPHLALIITMRGAERPAKIRWTRPFLLPLKPLSPEAARETFKDIADDSHEPKDIDQLLQLTDNMPLAVALIAHLVDYEGCSSILNRWETERTSMISAGYDRGSDIDASIRVSLLSPRLRSSPGAKDLLSLLSILPDGLSDQELLQSELPIKDVLACKTVLLGTSLAYNDEKKRLKSLMPIREHMQKFHPPAPFLMQALRKYFRLLLGLYTTYKGSHQADRVNQITPNLGNLHHLLLQGLHPANPDLEDTISCIISLNSFSMALGHGRIRLMDKIPAVLQPGDHILQTQFITAVFNSLLYQPISNPEILAAQAISHLQHVQDPILQAKFYRALGYYYTNRDKVPEGMQSLEKALTLATSAGDINEQARILNMLAAAKWPVAEYAAGHILASKAQKLAELSANFHEEANALWIESGFCLQLGEYKHTLLLLKRAQERLKLGGMSGGHLASGILTTEADTYMLKSEYAEARSINIKISQNTSPEQDMFRHAVALLNLGAIDVILGLTGYDVEHNLESAKMLLNSIGYVAGVLCCEMHQASLKLEEGDLPTAKTMFQKCLKWSWNKDAQISAHCLGQMADVVRWRVTDFHWTTTYTVVYLAFAQKSKQKHDLHNALRCLGDVFLLEGDNRTAENLFIVALEGYTYMDVHCSRADCLVRLGDIMQKRGDLAGAESVWMEARPLFERSLQAKGVGQVDSRLAALKQDHVETIF